MKGRECLLCGVPQDRCLHQQATFAFVCFPHLISPQRHLETSLCFSRAAALPLTAQPNTVLSLKAVTGSSRNSHQCATNAFSKCRNRPFHKGQTLSVVCPFLVTPLYDIVRLLYVPVCIIKRLGYVCVGFFLPYLQASI